GKMVIEPTYTEAYDFYDGLAAVRTDTKFGFIDKTGKMVIEPKYTYVGSFYQGYASVSIDGVNYIYVDKNGKESAQIGGSTETQSNSEYWGVIDKTGKVTLEPSFINIGKFSEGLIEVQDPITSKWSYIDKYGKKAFENTFDDAYAFNQGLAKSKENYMFGFIDKKGMFVIPAKYYSTGFFSEDGLAPVQETSNSKWGYIDKTGKMAIEARFDYGDAFSEGMAVIQANGEYGFIDTKGNKVILFLLKKGK
ncbi:MAG: WG repeat-containing protein, partial [Candidatus Sericytochromatia bacterium]